MKEIYPYTKLQSNKISLRDGAGNFTKSFQIRHYTE